MKAPDMGHRCTLSSLAASRLRISEGRGADPFHLVVAHEFSGEGGGGVGLAVTEELLQPKRAEWALAPGGRVELRSHPVMRYKPAKG